MSTPPRPGRGVELTTRSDAADLPPIRAKAGARPETKHQPLLVGEAEFDAWRLVEVFSRTGRPFEVALAWSAGTGSGAQARITVARSARICVFARSLRVAAANLADAENRVGVTVGDGFAVTRNHLEVRGRCEGPAEVVVPPFAERVRLDVADTALLATSRVVILDGQGVPCGAVPASAQPPDGVPLGGALAVLVVLPAPVEWRVVFTLSI